MPSADIADAGRTVVHDVEPVRVEAEAETLAGFDGPPSPIAVPGLLGGGLGGLGGIQRKLSVGAAADPLEDEAEATAAAVVSFLRGGGSGSAAPPDAPGDTPPADTGDHTGDHTAHRHHLACEHAPKISRHAGHAGHAAGAGVGMAGGDLDTDLEHTLNRTRGTGTALPTTARRAMESAMGHDFSAVRVHTGPTATTLSRSMNADAFALGPDVYFRDGLPDVTTPTGAHLLAHELTHTVQQGHAPAATRGAGGDTAHRTVRRMGAGSAHAAPAKAPTQGPSGGGGKGQPTVAQHPAGHVSAQPAAQHPAAAPKPGSPPVHRTVKAPTVANSFMEIGSIADALVPGEGDSASLEVKVMIPLGAGGFIGTIDAKIEIARDKGFKLAAQLMFGAGYKNMFFEFKVEAGYAVEAVGKTAGAAAELLNFGTYKQVAWLNGTLAEEIWGSRAEGWANGVAKRDLVDKDTHVDAGLSTRANAKLGGDDGSATFEGAYKRQTRWGGEEHGFNPADAKQRAGHGLRVYEGSQTIDIGQPPVKILFLGNMEYLDGAMSAFTMKANVTIGESAIKGLNSQKIKAMVAKSMATLTAISASMSRNAQKDHANAGRVAGAVAQAGTAFVPGGQVEEHLEKQFGKIKDYWSKEPKSAVEAKNGIGFEFGIKVEVEDGKQTTAGYFELTQVQSVKVEFNVGAGASIEAEKKTRLLKGEISTGSPGGHEGGRH